VAGPATEQKIYQKYKEKNFAAVALEVFNGTAQNVRASLINRTGITYPVALNAGDVLRDYGVSRHYSVVVDQNGIIQYAAAGSNIPAITAVIDRLLATPTSVSETEASPFSFSLSENYPNPFNPSTTLAFSLDKRQQVSLKIYDMKGRLVNTVVNGILAQGEHRMVWNAVESSGRRVASGVYYAVLQGERIRLSQKMILLQ